MAAEGDQRDGATEARARMAWQPLVLAAVLIGGLYLYVWQVQGDELPIFYLQHQDKYIILLLLAGLAVTPLLASRASGFGLKQNWAVVTRPGRCALVLSATALLLWWGTYALMSNYPLTRDEHMVVFDMAVFAKGHLAEPMEAFWRPYARALVPAFLLQSDHPIGMVSAYLPGNALLRLAFSRLADPALLNPLLSMLGAVALLDIARREFRGDGTAVLLVMLLYLTSAQMLVSAMTVYAMTAHLAFNLIWLAAFLRGGRTGHGVAMIVGAYACGLHQLVFHPLFVAPFLLWRLARGEWRIALFYGVGYAMACGWWIAYPLLAQADVTQVGTAASQADFLHGRVLPLLLERDPNTGYLVAYNLCRFFAWQNLALLPLMIAAWPMVRRNEGIAAPLLAGILLSTVAVSLILPYQGHGWGYRYLHGFLGSTALLGGYGFVAQKHRRAGLDAMICLLTALTICFSIPWLMYQSYKFTKPFLAVTNMVVSQQTPIVLVDTHLPANMVDSVRNQPDLSNRPIVLGSRYLTPEMLAALCPKGPIAVITRADMHAAGMVPDSETRSPGFEKLLHDTDPGQTCFRTAVRP